MVAVIVAGKGTVAAELARRYRASGAAVHQIDFDRELEPQVEAIAGPVDLVVIADDFAPPAGNLDTLTRVAMGASLRRLTFLPFRLAALLKPQLAEAQGRLVLLSRTDARMTVPDATGRYLERPFRAASHALWRCLSVEWREAGIAVGLVALEEGTLPTDLARAIAGSTGEAHPVELVDLNGRILGW